jgi:hypothetical protein
VFEVEFDIDQRQKVFAQQHVDAEITVAGDHHSPRRALEVHHPNSSRRAISTLIPPPAPNLRSRLNSWRAALRRVARLRWARGARIQMTRAGRPFRALNEHPLFSIRRPLDSIASLQPAPRPVVRWHKAKATAATQRAAGQYRTVDHFRSPIGPPHVRGSCSSENFSLAKIIT